MNIRAHISTMRVILVQKNLGIVGGCVSACCGKERGSVSAWGTATQCILVSFLVDMSKYLAVDLSRSKAQQPPLGASCQEEPLTHKSAMMQS